MTVNKGLTCSVDGCEKDAKCRGWCMNHYMLWRRHGDPTKRARPHRGGTCQIDGCSEPNHAFGLCKAHDNQKRRVGDPLGTSVPEWHRITNVSREMMVGDCSICGEGIRLYYHSSRDVFVCGVKEHARSLAKASKGHLQRYNLTPEDYLAMLEAQHGVCAICGRDCTTGRRLAVDHDHSCCPEPGYSCGKCVRGLLCMMCNTRLHAMEDTDWAVLAARYLEARRANDKA